MNVLVISNQLSTDPTKIVNPVINNTNNALKDINIKITTIPIELGKYGLFAYIILFFKLLKLKVFTKKQPDVVHVHFGGIQALIVNIFYRKNAVVSFHGTDLHGGTPIGLFSKLKSKTNLVASKISAILSGQVTVVSSSLIEFLPQQVQCKSNVVPTGVDFSIFTNDIVNKELYKSELNLDDKCRYILFSDISGSCIKRRDIAEKVVSLLRNKGLNVELLILSGVSYELVPSYIKSSDLVLIVSDKEGSPNIVKEALAVGVPIASVDVGDVFEYISKEPSCVKLKNNDVAYICNKLYCFLQSQHAAIDIAQWKKTISIEEIARKYLSVYSELYAI